MEMDQTGGHHVKGKKLDSERQTSHFLSYAESTFQKLTRDRQETTWEKYRDSSWKGGDNERDLNKGHSALP